MKSSIVAAMFGLSISYVSCILLPAVMSGCVSSSKATSLSSDEKAKLKSFAVEALPASAKKLDINFEGKVRIVGVAVEPELAPPGTQVTVTTYWRADATLEDGWALFTHGKDDNTGRFENLDGVGPLRERKSEVAIFAPPRWEKGKIYADAQTFAMPDYGDAMGPELTLIAGVWREPNSRLKITAGASDGEQGGVVAHIKTGRTPRKGAEVPVLTIGKLAKGQVVIVDGKADEKFWATAATTGPFVNVGTGNADPTSAVGGSARLVYDDDNLYAFFDVRDTDLRGGYTDPKATPMLFTSTGQPKLWERDTVEIMLDPDGDGDNIDYYELQVNPENKVFHTQYDGYNTPKSDPSGPYGHEDWDPKLKSVVVLNGTLNDTKADVGYSVEIAIPWRSFTKAKQTPPQIGDGWRMNFYAMKDNGGQAWSPILGQGNFHKATRFGRVTWGGEGGALPAPAAPSAPRLHGVVKLPE